MGFSPDQIKCATDKLGKNHAMITENTLLTVLKSEVMEKSTVKKLYQIFCTHHRYCETCVKKRNLL
jgi:hypothetical protein